MGRTTLAFSRELLHFEAPKCFSRYVDDAFVIWKHGREKLRDFLNHLNSRHSNITFTMEIEEEGHFPFLDADGTLSHSVYRKPTHTDLYLNDSSHHHSAQLRSVLSKLTHRAYAISDEESLPGEIKHLRSTFLQNGYRLINRALKSKAE
ncbi:hypothetical protein J437_LFUL000996 [Ladona fulva]|uniref:Helix-turn-helix domain-containing protein n=1 Tax=Ladona fulva TaxID=123851 RepID=A0A8K0P2N5_LADFU|nr:hypothetical protein J437_LFUL000996 [Ladona fulva]